MTFSPLILSELQSKVSVTDSKTGKIFICTVMERISLLAAKAVIKGTKPPRQMGGSYPTYETLQHVGKALFNVEAPDLSDEQILQVMATHRMIATPKFFA